jgi:hypothetical protein
LQQVDAMNRTGTATHHTEGGHGHASSCHQDCRFAHDDFRALIEVGEMAVLDSLFR